MFSTQALRAQLRGLGTAAVTGFLVSMLATTQMFAQSATIAPAPGTTTTNNATATVPQNAALNNETPAESSSSSLVAEANLPAAPAPAAEPAAAPDPLGQAAVSKLTSNSGDHKVKRPGQLAVGIAGAVLMGFGTYIYALNGSAKGRAIVGSMFFAPGAVMAGFGFTLAFKPKH